MKYLKKPNSIPIYELFISHFFNYLHLHNFVSCRNSFVFRQVYCCIGMLSITGQLFRVKVDTLGWWLCERQLPSGGLNGRPEKLPDVCYSWWVVASLRIIGRLDWLDQSCLKNFILASQDVETGGFSDRPGDMPDPFHTLFGLAGLSLVGQAGLQSINPVFCMPQTVIDRLQIRLQIL